jgi:hypothetical protein
MRRSAGLVCAAGLSVWLVSCGYIGPVRPPSPRIPIAVNDLAVTEIGDAIQCSFTLPELTSDQLTIDTFHLIDLRIGPDVKPFDLGTWAAASRPIHVPEDQTADETNNRQVAFGVPASEWLGKEVAVAVRTAAHKQNYSSWSNVVHLRIINGLEPPEIRAASDAKGVKITFALLPPQSKGRIMRQGPNDPAPIEAGTTDSTVFIDTGADYGTKYLYTAVTFDDTDHANAVSKPSKAVPITPIDKFAPEVPTNVTALPGPNSIEISWERSPAPDTKGYYVYRSVNGGAFQRIGDLTTLPTYGDKDVKRGNKYGYQVNAIDQRGNPSERSAPVEVAY